MVDNSYQIVMRLSFQSYRRHPPKKKEKKRNRKNKPERTLFERIKYWIKVFRRRKKQKKVGLGSDKSLVFPQLWKAICYSAVCVWAGHVFLHILV